jgi:hypothetical protein
MRSTSETTFTTPLYERIIHEQHASAFTTLVVIYRPGYRTVMAG